MARNETQEQREKRLARNARKCETNRAWRARNPEKVREQKKAAYRRERENETPEKREDRMVKQRETGRKYRDRNPEKVRERSREAMRQRRKENPEAVRDYNRDYRRKNREKINARKREAAAQQLEENPEAVRATARKYSPRYRDKRISYVAANRSRINAARSTRLKANTDFRLACNLRTRLCSAIRGEYKAGSAVRDLGCTIPELKAHLEAQFTEGMSWANWGHTGDVWHIDHRRALASFNLTDREQLKLACHYTNLQPLWAKENLRKGARV